MREGTCERADHARRIAPLGPRRADHGQRPARLGRRADSGLSLYRFGCTDPQRPPKVAQCLPLWRLVRPGHLDRPRNAEKVRSQFLSLHHPVLANRRSPARRQIGRSCRDFGRFYSRILVSASVRTFERRFLALRLCIQKFRSRRLWLSAKPDRTRPGGIRLLSHRNSGPWARAVVIPD